MARKIKTIKQYLNKAKIKDPKIRSNNFFNYSEGRFCRNIKNTNL